MKNITIDSLLDIRFVSEPALSPDGAHTAYVVSKQNYKENSYESWIHVMDNASGQSRQLTFAGKEDGFVWDEDGSILFAAQRADADKPEKFAHKTCFYRLNIHGGEAQKAFEIDKDVAQIRPLGEGKYLVLATVDLNEKNAPADETLHEDEKDYHVLEEIPFWANGRGYISRLRSTLYLFTAADGKTEQITSDFMNVHSFDVRSGKVLYSGCEYQDKLSILGEARLYDLSDKTTATLVEPGKYSVGDVALCEHSAVIELSTMQPWGLCQLPDLYRCDLNSHELTLAQPMDGLCVGPNILFDCTHGGGNTFKAVGDEVYLIGQRRDRAEIYRLSAENELTRLFDFDGCVWAMDVNKEEIIFVGHKANGLGELYRLKQGAPVPCTAVNDTFLSEHYVAEAKYLPFVDSDGVEIDGWVLEPQGFDPAAVKQYPAVLEIHGGPRCAYGTVFFHEMQALVGAGYVVFFCNPRGSEGYGEEFADLRGHYGTVDYQDLMEFTDHILEKYPAIDPRRLGAAGGSYGGFMCNWIEGHTDRFAAIASQRSVSNWVADFGASEIGFTFDQNEMGATPWTDMEKMWEQSPVKYACYAKTPILFIHSLGDYNCTLDQGVEMFTAMKYFGVPSRMVLFEGENHSLSRSGKPRHRLRRLREIIGWFDRYLVRA